jgi:hypothetical protein
MHRLSGFRKIHLIYGVSIGYLFYLSLLALKVLKENKNMSHFIYDTILHHETIKSRWAYIRFKLRSNDSHKKIYDALNIPYQPGKMVKTIL